MSQDQPFPEDMPSMENPPSMQSTPSMQGTLPVEIMRLLLPPLIIAAGVAIFFALYSLRKSPETKPPEKEIPTVATTTVEPQDDTLQVTLAPELQGCPSLKVESSLDDCPCGVLDPPKGAVPQRHCLLRVSEKYGAGDIEPPSFRGMLTFPGLHPYRVVARWDYPACTHTG